MGFSDIDDLIFGLTSTQASFALWACPLKLINFSVENVNKKSLVLGNNNSNL